MNLRPLDKAPRDIRPPFTKHRETDFGQLQSEGVSALEAALDGVELGAYDHRIISWLAAWDKSTVGTVVSLILRAREAGNAAQPPTDVQTNRTEGDPR